MEDFPGRTHDWGTWNWGFHIVQLLPPPAIEAGRPFIHWTLTFSLGNRIVSSGYHVYEGDAYTYFLAHISSLD